MKTGVTLSKLTRLRLDATSFFVVCLLASSRAGFGSADERGANFLMADGLTRFIAHDIDPGVLTTLATPD